MSEKHYVKDGIEFYIIQPLIGNQFFIASQNHQDVLVHSEEEGIAFFKYKNNIQRKRAEELQKYALGGKNEKGI